MTDDFFPGFPDGSQSMIGIPKGFFSDLLTRIDHLVEMQVTLYCFWALQTQEGRFRYVRFKEVCEDELFMAMIARQHDDPMQALRDGFERAVVRGTLLHVLITFENDTSDDIYFMNTEKGRIAVKAIEKGDWVPGGELRPIGLIIEQPNIYHLYEQHIGGMNAFIAEQLMDMSNIFPPQWIEEAFQIASLKNVRHLKYVQGILKRWKDYGRDNEYYNQKEEEAYLEDLRRRFMRP